MKGTGETIKIAGHVLGRMGKPRKYHVSLDTWMRVGRWWMIIEKEEEFERLEKVLAGMGSVVPGSGKLVIIKREGLEVAMGAFRNFRVTPQTISPSEFVFTLRIDIRLDNYENVFHTVNEEDKFQNRLRQAVAIARQVLKKAKITRSYYSVIE